MEIKNIEYFKDAQWLAREAIFLRDRKNPIVVSQILWNDAMKLLKKAYGHENNEG
ncbi:hypothetical protein bas08_0039 [Escherichia phage DanielBernoulli]|uniref:Uncharacterized protein n=1 Tax=Escherichia phage DanielBernoulli TaxID=2851972 RepID=A0AAE8AXY5_9CAUD|nr:hypothetical protein bas08_0039 [Escherichia phage DanielBernoulli]